MPMKGPIFRFARGIFLHLYENVASSSASSYINILWLSFVSRRSNRTQTHTQFVIPSLKDGERQFRPGSFHELQDNSNETQTQMKLKMSQITLK